VNRAGSALTSAALSAALLAQALSGVGCVGRHKVPTEDDSWRTRVSLEETDASRARASVRQERTPWTERLFTPIYSKAVLPDYPVEAESVGAPPVRVRVDFRVGADGLAHDVRTTVLDASAHAELFAGNCVAAMERWRFSPAWRLAGNPQEGDGVIVLLDYKAQLVFRFDLEVDGGAGVLESGSDMQ